MAINRPQLVTVVAITMLYLVGQLAVGTDPAVASLFSAAILFGLFAVFAGGGLASAFGCLNALLIAKFLLFGVAIKIMLLQPADSYLIAPVATAAVMAIGFFGLFVGTLAQSRFSCPRSFSLDRPYSDRMLLSFSIVLFVFSYCGYFAAMIPSTQGEGLQTGGWLGVARAVASLKSLSVVPPMLYLWRKKTDRWMTHPVIVAIVGWAAIVGIFSTNKQDAMEPLAFYFLVGFLRYGWRDIRLWGFVSAAVIYYGLIIFPYSQYVRHAGGREGTFQERATVIKDVFWRIAGDQEFRSTITDRVSRGSSYFGVTAFAPFGRLAMVSEADKLIAATERQQSFTGWETITWGFKLATPSFLYPDKPIFEAGNYLGHVAGEVGPSDTTTQISYGVMANWYNAFSYTGVLIGTPVFFALLYYWLRMFLGEARWEGLPTISVLWFLWLIASFQHSIVESTLSGLIPALLLPITLGMLCAMAGAFSMFLPADHVKP
jgi:hypothetical protein